MNKVSQMKVTKALKLKNKLAGEVSNLKQMLKIQNSRPTKQPFDYSSREVWQKLCDTIERLVQVKTALAVANVEVYEKMMDSHRLCSSRDAETIVKLQPA